MYVRRNIPASTVFRFSWQFLLGMTTWSILVLFLSRKASLVGWKFELPFAPVSTIGIAVAFYVGFKNSQSYDRSWEARKIWGGIVNHSRIWANQVLSFVTHLHAEPAQSQQECQPIHKTLIYRQIAWLNALSLSLRRPSTFSPKFKGAIRSLAAESPVLEDFRQQVKPYLNEQEYESLCDKQNLPAQLLRQQAAHLTELRQGGLIDDFRHMEMMRVLDGLYNLQGRCERVKNTPFPRGFAFFSQVFTWIFVVLLPPSLLGLFKQMGPSYDLLMVPFAILIGWIFHTMETVGDTNEDPFEGFVNDVPMTSLSRKTEIDMREMLGEVELPSPISATDGILL